ncbi:acyltransferase family protein [Microbacterium sp. RG1]|uniref:acyltransferase family protein n=1 Tax=Microbacterium sp. RG1 TaxID=2489212 RepID=UPI0010CA2883|nr:acyltransferase [Microbacterium sp. RG1]QCQ17552.1 acyltransferase [Microbacterium sp. RG1]
MVTTLTAPRTAIAPAADRDTGIDLARAICVVIVVLLHAVMVGVTVTPAGPVFANAAEDTAWFAPLTWVAQIMPLFFVIGGYAGALAYRRMRRTGGTAGAFVAARVHRLLVPALLTFAVVAVALAALLAAGVDGELVRIAGFRYAQPLWFLAVFLLCQALLPALLAAHERAPLRTIVLLVAAAGAVDAMRAVTGIDAIGMLNLACVWLALQQLGFVMADGTIDALRRRTRVVIGVAAVAVLASSMIGGVFSADLYENLNPPTTALLLVGLAQTTLLSLLRAPLAAASRRPPVAAFTGFVTARTMTIYLWHMPVLLTMAGASALFALTTGLELPEPSSPTWWLTRLPWFVVALSLTAVVAWALAGLERRRMPRPTASVARISHAVLLGLAAIVLLLAAGTSVLTAIAAIALGLSALARIRGGAQGSALAAG